MIGILGLDRYFKRVNPAMCSRLEYTEKQLLDMPLDLLVHPDDVEISRERTKAFITGDQTMYFENRFMSKSGKAIWLSWTVTRSANEKWLFYVGKDISDKKEIENLLHKANQLARIGSWKIDRVNRTAHWSPITREIYEVPESFVPDAKNWLSFYREGADRDYIAGKIASTIATGMPATAKLSWLRHWAMSAGSGQWRKPNSGMANAYGYMAASRTLIIVKGRNWRQPRRLQNEMRSLKVSVMAFCRQP